MLYLTDGNTAAGDELITCSNGELSMTVTPFGARLVELLVPDRRGEIDTVVLGFDDVPQYRANVNTYFGATVGRVCGRISGGTFSLDDRRYQLARNEGVNHLHGGSRRSLDRVTWSAARTTSEHGPGVLFRYVSSSGEEGYPGKLDVEVEYSLSKNNELWNVITAVTDEVTPVNLTNHSYWTLNGGQPGSVLDHELWLRAERVIETGPDLIPTGRLKPVAGTPLDFRRIRQLGQELPERSTEPWPGFDSPYVLDDHGQGDAIAILRDPVNGRTMTLFTSEPSLQVYTANRLGAMVGRWGRRYGAGSSICLEPQRFPDAVNRPEFPSILLEPHQEFRHVSCYQFSAT